MSFHEYTPINKKDQDRIDKKFHEERVRTRAGGKEDPNFNSKMGSMSAKAINKGYKTKALEKAKDWHSIGAGRVGDKYKGGTITEMDYRNGRAKVSAPSIDKKEYKGITKALKGAMKD